MKFTIVFTFFLLFLAACNAVQEEKPVNEVSLNSVELISIEGMIDEDGSYRSDKGQFIVEFPEGEVLYENEQIDSEVGRVHYHTFVVADPLREDYMVSVSYYPKKHVKEKGGKQMLTDAFGGISKGIAPFKIDFEEDFLLNELPGKRFRIHGKEWYILGELLMIDTRLYQKLILKKGAYADAEKSEAFLASFHLLSK